ncbi:MAG: calcium/sodium antiporter [Ruminococcus sp.]|nr:calcium/sodium antiporter [Ruminococcus sp.]
MELFLNILLLIAGFALLIKGADFFVDGASGIADKFGIPQIIIGLTIVALGTSAPEAAVSITAAFNQNTGVAIGNVIGSNILNIFIILGVTSCITPLTVQKNTLRYEIPFVIFITALLVVMGGLLGELGLIAGIILLAVFAVFFVYLIRTSKNGGGEEESEEPKKKKPVWLLILMTLLGLAGIILGSDFTVDGATVIAKTFGMSDRLIGLTIVALGTSLPELVTSIVAGKKGNSDIAVGNIVGSNIFNILFVLGLTAVICPIPYEPKFVIDGIIAIAAAILLLLCIIFDKEKKIRRWGGITMLVCYAGYFVYLIMG